MNPQTQQIIAIVSKACPKTTLDGTVITDPAAYSLGILQPAIDQALRAGKTVAQIASVLQGMVQRSGWVHATGEYSDTDLKDGLGMLTPKPRPGGPTTGPAAPDAPNPIVLDATDVAEEIYQRTLNDPPVYANGYEVCNQADWFSRWKNVAQLSYAKLLGDDWAGVPLETRHVAAYYLWFDVNAPGPRENKAAPGTSFTGPLTPAELAGMDPAQLVQHVDPSGAGSPSGNVGG